MKSTAALMAALIPALVSPCLAAGNDPNDGVLTVYELTDAQSSSFQAADQKISAFWDSWTGKDYIDMNTTSNSYPGRDAWGGLDDARITIKAGYSKLGVYLYCEVTDNVWVDPVSGSESWGYDAVDLYFDNKSSAGIGAGGEAIMVNLAYGWALTYTSQQIQVWMGSTTLPTTFRYSYYDETYWDWSRNEVEFATAATTYNGMAMEVVKKDDTHKTQEWFIPWSQVGVGGVSGAPTAGTRFGFSGGYNDMDGEGGAVKSLRWKQYDPFSDAANAMASWGDLELEPNSAARQMHRAPLGRPAANVTSTQYFTLNGQKVRKGSLGMLRGAAGLIERSALADGTVTARRVQVAR